MLVKIFTIAGSFFLTVALLGSAGLGVWNYNLNNQLELSQADYQALKSDYDKLEAESNQSKADYETQSNQAQAELESARAEIKRLERELEQAQAENKTVKDKLSNIQSKVAVLNAFWFTSDASFANRVDQSNDEQLKKLYAALGESQSWEPFTELMSYLIESIAQASGISWQPVDNL